MLPALVTVSLLHSLRPCPQTFLRRCHSAPQMRLQTTRVVVPFKGVPASDAMRLIHTPEMWAAGSWLLCGLDPFIYYDVQVGYSFAADFCVC